MRTIFNNFAASHSKPLLTLTRKSATHNADIYLQSVYRARASVGSSLPSSGPPGLFKVKVCGEHSALLFRETRLTLKGFGIIHEPGSE